MMRRFRTISTRFWMSPHLQALSVETRLIALYLIAGPHTNDLGCFRLPKSYVAEDLNIPLSKVTMGFVILADTGMLRFDPQNDWVFLPNFFKFNPIQNTNQGRHIETLFKQVPLSSVFMPELLRALHAQAERLSASFKKHLDNLLEKYSEHANKGGGRRSPPRFLLIGF
jgi:hypothetical protein